MPPLLLGLRVNEQRGYFIFLCLPGEAGRRMKVGRGGRLLGIDRIYWHADAVDCLSTYALVWGI